jgi:polar amino acid transport system substrate-binding protein
MLECSETRIGKLFFRAPVKLLTATLLCVGILATGPAQAQIRVVTGEFPPLTINGAGDKGLLYDIVEEIKKLVGVSAPTEFLLWNDASKLAQTDSNVVIFPLTRTEQREKNFRWMPKIFDLKRSFASLPGTPAVNTPEDAKKLAAVGVLERSASLTFLKEYGLTNIIEFPSNSAMIKSLEEGKIAAAYSAEAFTKTEWRTLGKTTPLVYGVPLEVSGSYIGLSLKGDAVKIQEWQDAFGVIQQEGTFEKLLIKYGLN